MFRVVYITAVAKDIKALPLVVQELLHQKYFPELSSNPFVGKPLVGIFKGYYSKAFSFVGTQYRLVYEINKKQITVIIVMIGSRENLYKNLKRRI